MKELELTSADKIEIVDQKQIKKHLRFEGQKTLKRGHILFEYNTITKECVPATFEPIDYVVGQTSARKKLVAKPDCWYIGALNKKNALKRL